MSHQEIYYHGTDARSAQAVLSSGFMYSSELSKHGTVHGRGTYVCHRLETTTFWGEWVVECRLRPGTRILWLDGACDQKVLKRLAKEFGKEILSIGPNALRVIPHNKRLTPEELVNFAKHVYKKRPKRSPIFTPKGYKEHWFNYEPLNKMLRMHKFDGVGGVDPNVWDGDEVLVFNPSNVLPIRVLKPVVANFEGFFDGKGPIKLLSAVEVRKDVLVAAAAKQKEEDDAFDREWEACEETKENSK